MSKDSDAAEEWPQPRSTIPVVLYFFNALFCRSMTETTVDFGARRSDFDSASSMSGRSGRLSQYTAGARLAKH
jgi:hypothetical protein